MMEIRAEPRPFPLFQSLVAYSLFRNFSAKPNAGAINTNRNFLFNNLLDAFAIARPP